MTMVDGRIAATLLAASLLAGCVSGPAPRAPVAPSAPVPAVEPVVGEDGRCTGGPQIDPAAFRSRTTDAAMAGMTECEVVAVKGAPLSVQSGSSPRAKRETTMLYMEPAGKAIYSFADNRLVRVWRAGAQ